MKSSTNLDKVALEEKPLQEIYTMDADVIAYYVARGRKLRSEAEVRAVRSMAHAISTSVKGAYHFATDWMVDLYHPRAH